MYCSECGKEIESETKFCPHCGANQDKSVKTENITITQDVKEEKKNQNIFSILGFVLSLISLLLSFFGLVGIAAVVLSIMGLIKMDEYKSSGKAFAIIGIVVGGISILYALFTII